MLRRTLAALIPFLAVPLTLHAQERADQPMILSISAWVCPPNAVQDITQSYQTYTQPVEKELIDEGMLVNTGLFFHAWGDEWNVNYFRIAPTLEGLFDAVSEVTRRVNQRHPELADAPNPFGACSAHKDNIYFMPTTTAALEPGG
jgi:hypothetical protein